MELKWLFIFAGVVITAGVSGEAFMQWQEQKCVVEATKNSSFSADEIMKMCK
jgi:hypothetical protein